jgi:predicted nucleic acid-binding protein
MKLTYLDSGVLIAFWRGIEPLRSRIESALNDPTREFASSQFVMLETIMMPSYHKQTAEVAFYIAFFSRVTRWADDIEAVIRRAFVEGAAAGLAAMDALHVSAALEIGCDELITIERPRSPYGRVKSIPVVTLYKR